MNNIFKTCARICASALLLFLVAHPAAAQDRGGFAFASFDADLLLARDGSLAITETITGEFFELRHGLFRFLPVSYDAPGPFDHVLDVEVERILLNGRAVPYETYREGKFLVLKIGDPYREFQGAFAYEIRYRMEGLMLAEDDHDLLYWNITGTDWGVPIPYASARVEIEGLAPGHEIAANCFTGPAGSTERHCGIGHEGAALFFEAETFLTIQVETPKGLIASLSERDRFLLGLRRNADFLFFLLVPLTAALMYSRWRAHGKDPDTGSLVVQYDPPDNLRPVEVHTLVGSPYDSMGFGAFIVDLAVRGYLTITENEKKNWLTAKSYTLARTEKTDGLVAYEEAFLASLFSNEKTRVLTSTYDEKIKAAWDMARDHARKANVGRGYETPENARVPGKYFLYGLGYVFAGTALGVAFLILTGRSTLLLAALISAFPIFVIGMFMGKRTESGARAYAHAKGFREYLTRAEQYRIQWQEKENVFETFLPYAMVFGVADRWTKALADTITRPPDWYHGAAAGAFVATDFASAVTSFSATAGGSATVPSSSSSGGSSGGGFGGGGGGSW